MHFHANVEISPSEVLNRLAAVPGERGSSWASHDVLASSVGRLYVWVSGSRFEASLTAGVAVLTVIAVGQVQPAPTGSTLALRFQYGPFPTWAAPFSNSRGSSPRCSPRLLGPSYGFEHGRLRSRACLPHCRGLVGRYFLHSLGSRPALAGRRRC
jgi:hypothetical protein